MGNPLGVYETNCKVKYVKYLLLGKLWAPSDLLFLEWSYYKEMKENEFVWAVPNSDQLKINAHWHLGSLIAAQKFLGN